MNEETRMLGQAIAEMAILAGITNGEQPLTGAQLLLLAEDVKTEITRLNAKVAELQEAESCPNCLNVGWYVVPDNFTGEPSQEQCQWCYETKNSIFNARANTESTCQPCNGKGYFANRIHQCGDCKGTGKRESNWLEEHDAELLSGRDRIFCESIVAVQYDDGKRLVCDTEKLLGKVNELKAIRTQGEQK